MNDVKTQGASFDPVSLEIMWSRLINITEECWITILKTAFSLIIGEAQDFGCELLDAAGETLAHSPRSMPVFNLTLPRAVKALLAEFPPETLQPGDVLITNDPWLCAGHLFDVALVTPVFKDGRLVGHIGSIAHWSDIGGTRDALSAREIYEEGLQIPPLKLYRGGEPNRDLYRLIERNVRKSEMVLGDLQAQVSANEVGAERLLHFMDEYDLEELSGLAHVIQDRSEAAMREAIQAVPDGVYSGTVDFDGIGEPMSLTTHVTVEGDQMTVDWDAPEQLERGGINCTLNYSAAHCVYALKSMLTPDIPSNAGCFRPIEVYAPEGSILNCRYPASVNIRTMSGWYCGPALFKALEEALPERVQAFTGLPVSMGAYGYGPDGLPFNDHLFQGGGQGAGAHGDGKSALLYPTSAANTSVEMFEMRVPLLVEMKELLADSAGPGRHRGGLGQRVQMRKLFDDDRAVLVTWPLQGILKEISGLAGGRSGSLTNLIVEEGEARVEGHAVGSLVELRRSAQLATADLPGGSGFGDSRERPLELVQADFDEGYLTAEGLAAYGCRLDASGRVQRSSVGE
jgi:5-oxoprolinase (ATP-hydrolysing)/N-methylhydantoinase A